MGKKQTITWRFIVSLGLPLIVVGAAAMAISYATLIDVARINGLPLPELFPILVDVGTVAAMVAAAQFKIRGIKGRPLAYVTFMALSGVSIVANAVHAMNAADLTKTSVMFAAVLAATPPATLLAVTHLVMMLIPEDKQAAVVSTPAVPVLEKNRTVTPAALPRSVKEQVAEEPLRSVSQTQQTRQAPVTPPTTVGIAPAAPAPRGNVQEEKLPDSPVAETLSDTDSVSVPEPREVLTATDFNQTGLSKEETTRLVLLHIEEMGARPTGAQVAKWLGKAPRTGHRFLTKLEEDNIIQPATGEQKILLSK